MAMVHCMLKKLMVAKYRKSHHNNESGFSVMQTDQSGFFNFNFKNEQASCFVISLWW